jgi:hypothetical protein
VLPVKYEPLLGTPPYEGSAQQNSWRCASAAWDIGRIVRVVWTERYPASSTCSRSPRTCARVTGSFVIWPNDSAGVARNVAAQKAMGDVSFVCS